MRVENCYGLFILFLTACTVLCSNFNYEESADSDDEGMVVLRYLENDCPEATAIPFNPSINAIEVNLASSQILPSPSAPPLRTYSDFQLQELRQRIRAVITRKFNQLQVPKEVRADLISLAVGMAMEKIQEIGRVLDEDESITITITFTIKLKCEPQKSFCCVS